MVGHITALALVLTTVVVGPVSADWATVDSGKDTKDNVQVSFELRLNERTAPGDYVFHETNIYGRIGDGVMSTTSYYFAGVDGRTLHLVRIEKERRGMGDERDRRQLPILLPLGPDDAVTLLIRPLNARPLLLTLKRGADQTLSASFTRPPQ